jgi:imidazolonepropionase-like amidohydrolase
MGVVGRALATVRRVVARNPFLTVALLALLTRHGLPVAAGEGFGDGVVGLIWRGAVLALRPFNAVATWVDPWLRAFPEWVDVGVTLLAGLAPYAALDAALRWARRRGRSGGRWRRPGSSYAAALAGAIVAAAVAATPSALDAQVQVFHGAVLIDGSGAEPLADAVIVVEDSLIVCAGRASDCAGHAARDPEASVDLTGAWIIPGLIDLHLHIDVRDEAALAGLLEAGVTTARDVGPLAAADTGSYEVGHGQVERLEGLASRLRRGEVVGPRIYHCGTGLHSSDSEDYPPSPRFIRLRSDGDVGRVIRYLVDRGASCVKLIGGTTPRHMREALEAAVAAGVAGLGHSSTDVPLAEQLTWPWAEIHHFWFPFEDVLAPAQRVDLPQGQWARWFVAWARFDPAAPEARALAAEAAGTGIAWVPTIVGAERFPWGMDMDFVRLLLDTGAAPGDDDILRQVLFDPVDPAGPVGPGDPAGTDRPAHLPHPARSAADSVAVLRAAMARFSREWTGLLHHAGATILAGSDADAATAGIHDELEQLVAAGLTPAEALASATRLAAAALGEDHRVGTLAAGMLADFVVLDADPLEDIRHTRAIRHVVQGGVVRTPVQSSVRSALRPARSPTGAAAGRPRRRSGRRGTG